MNAQSQEGYVRSRRYSFDLVTHLVGREFRIRYRRALFGWLWAVGSPLARLAVLAVVFGQVLPLGIPNYPVFVFTGLIAWSWFSSGVASATTSPIDRKDLLFRPGLPRHAIPVVSVMTDGLDYFAALPILLAFLVFTTGIPLTAVLLPLILAIQILFTVGLGFLLATANVYLRDVKLFVEVALLLGFYLTPVFYRPGLISDERLRTLLSLNPMSQLLDAYRRILIQGTLPDVKSTAALIASGILIFVAGYMVYARKAPVFVDEL